MGRTHNLGHVQDDNGRLETDTKTSNETTDDDSGKGITRTSNHLDNDTKHVDKAASDDGPLSANSIGDISGDNSAQEGTQGQNRNDERGPALRDLFGTLELDRILEDLRTQDTIDVSRVVAEEDTAKGSKSADHIRLPRDWGLDPVDVVGGLEHNTISAGRRLLVYCLIRHVE